MAQLTEMKIKAIKPGAKMARYYDSGGLYLQVSPTGGKYWRFKYRVEKKEKLVALGTWPQVSLKEAREKRDRCRQEIAAGNDPMQLKKARAEAVCPGRTFQEVAEALAQQHGECLVGEPCQDDPGTSGAERLSCAGEERHRGHTANGDPGHAAQDRSPGCLRDRPARSVRLWNRLSSRHYGLNMVSVLRPRSDTA